MSPSSLPAWASEIAARYRSGANNHFLLHGNVEDRFVLGEATSDDPMAGRAINAPSSNTGSLLDFLLRALLGSFDVVLSYDLGNGIRVEKGQAVFSSWPALKGNPPLAREPRPALETLTHYARYCANLGRIGQKPPRLALVVQAVQLIAPQGVGPSDHYIGALALLLREWSLDSLLAEGPFAAFLICENLSDLHTLVAANPRAAAVRVPLPETAQLQSALEGFTRAFPRALGAFAGQEADLAPRLRGATLSSLETLLQMREHEGIALAEDDVAGLKKSLVEADAGDLIEWIEPARTLDDYSGSDAVKAWLRADIELWRQNDLDAMPMGYLLCGPVGTGKTFLVDCLAGEAGVPVVKIKNFRDRWIGSTEGNLEKIFRLLGALGRCYVFVDEADQTLGRRESGAGDSGLSGRVYSMFAQEMSRASNRGRIVWILASSRPDLIEVDLKRPGRIDVKIPLFPAATPREAFDLVRALLKRRDLHLEDEDFGALERSLPELLTPGAAEALAVKVYRATRVQDLTAPQALSQALQDYRPPVSAAVLTAQIELAIAESSDSAFVPPSLRHLAPRTL